MEKIFVLAGGGLGDCFINYFNVGFVIPGNPWNKLKALKESRECYIKAVLACHNDAIIDFVRYHPYIDELEILPYTALWDRYSETLEARGWINAAGYDVEISKPVIWQGPHDIDRLMQITNGKPYIVVHPTAGTPDRALTSYHVDHPSMPTITIGVSDDLNARLCALLTWNASLFVGTFSAYAWVASAAGVISRVYLPDDYLNDDHTAIARRVDMKILPFSLL